MTKDIEKNEFPLDSNRNYYSDLMENSRAIVAKKLGWSKFYEQQKNNEMLNDKNALRYKFASAIILIAIGVLIVTYILVKVFL